MQFIHDTRDKIGKHDNVDNYLIANGHTIIRSKLYVGDVSLLKDQSVCVDLKQDMQEVYGNVIQSHTRFKAELLRAQQANIKLIILVEQGELKTLTDVPGWENPRLIKWHKVNEAHRSGKMMNVKIASTPPVNSHKLYTIMYHLSARYGVEWQFCKKEETAQKLIELLGERQ